MTDDPQPTLGALFATFLRFGCQAWGGPVAQIAMLRRELVDRDRWIEPPRFNRLLAVYQALPGPESHELCVHLGMIKRGRMGGVAAGLGFMLPGLVLMLALSWAYTRTELDQPLVAAALLGVQVAVVALIVRATHKIGVHVLGSAALWAVAIGVGAASLVEVPFWISLPAAGLAYAAFASGKRVVSALVLAVAIALAVAVRGPETLGNTQAVLNASGSAAAWPLFLSGLKAGMLTFGGAYTAIPFVRGDAMRQGWIDDATFLDALALSQVIPAPLIIFVTFVGYQAGGMAGALAMTAGTFAPAFAFTLIFFDRLEAVIDDPRLHRLLEGAAAGVVGLIVATAINLALGVAATVPSYLPGLLIFGIALIVFFASRSKIAVPAVLALAAAAGVVAFQSLPAT